MLNDKKYPVWTPGPARDRLIREHLQWLEERNKALLETPEKNFEGSKILEWTQRHVRRKSRRMARARSYYLNTKDSARGFTERRASKKFEV